jgi:hypothetical protein
MFRQIASTKKLITYDVPFHSEHTQKSFKLDDTIAMDVDDEFNALVSTPLEVFHCADRSLAERNSLNILYYSMVSTPSKNLKLAD